MFSFHFQEVLIAFAIAIWLWFCVVQILARVQIVTAFSEKNKN